MKRLQTRRGGYEHILLHGLEEEPYTRIKMVRREREIHLNGLEMMVPCRGLLPIATEFVTEAS
jgi:hypothetical protein